MIQSPIGTTGSARFESRYATASFRESKTRMSRRVSDDQGAKDDAGEGGESDQRACVHVRLVVLDEVLQRLDRRAR
jgi:hypothetical protein